LEADVGQAIVKAAKDQDLYLVWSSVVDAPIFVGDRESVLAELRAGGTTKPAPPSRRRAGPGVSRGALAEAGACGALNWAKLKSGHDSTRRRRVE